MKRQLNSDLNLEIPFCLHRTADPVTKILEHNLGNKRFKKVFNTQLELKLSLTNSSEENKYHPLLIHDIICNWIQWLDIQALMRALKTCKLLYLNQESIKKYWIKEGWPKDQQLENLYNKSQQILFKHGKELTFENAKKLHWKYLQVKKNLPRVLVIQPAVWQQTDLKFKPGNAVYFQIHELDLLNRDCIGFNCKRIPKSTHWVYDSEWVEIGEKCKLMEYLEAIYGFDDEPYISDAVKNMLYPHFNFKMVVAEYNFGKTPIRGKPLNTLRMVCDWILN
jgi:hypothetical protein